MSWLPVRISGRKEEGEGRRKIRKEISMMWEGVARRGWLGWVQSGEVD